MYILSKLRCDGVGKDKITQFCSKL